MKNIYKIMDNYKQQFSFKCIQLIQKENKPFKAYYMLKNLNKQIIDIVVNRN